ncbi:unnamed protein product [Haemonchus placei]|uniref:Secreted protein n=1 Tax=Haemonchus placei TaxID=6290 RepID=A0A0N4W582_HAEPC|nr:unnamed protein product [Haemonchus placei]
MLTAIHSLCLLVWLRRRTAPKVSSGPRSQAATLFYRSQLHCDDGKKGPKGCCELFGPNVDFLVHFLDRIHPLKWLFRDFSPVFREWLQNSSSCQFGYLSSQIDLIYEVDLNNFKKTTDVSTVLGKTLFGRYKRSLSDPFEPIGNFREYSFIFRVLFDFFCICLHICLHNFHI